MSKYLDQERLPEFLARYFGTEAERKGRMVGPDRNFDSGYFDIIRFFGEDAIDPSAVRIRQSSEQYRFSDPLVAAFAAEMEARLRGEGRLYDGPLSTRVIDADFSVQSPTIAVQPCRYPDQAGTCFALDWPDSRFANSGGTLREYYRSRISQSLFADIPFPLCFGVCGFLLTDRGATEMSFLFVQRSGKLASLENSVGPSMAGSVDYEQSDRTLVEMLDRSAMQEIEEELLLNRAEYELIPLAYAREIFRGERPQLFCLIRTTLSQHEIADRLREESGDREFSSFEFVSMSGEQIAETAVQALNHEARMSYWLSMEFLDWEKRR